MNREAIRQHKSMMEYAMCDLEAWLTTIIPGGTPCLTCLVPEEPPGWKREFPVFGPVSGTMGCLAATEAIKILAGFGIPFSGWMLACDLREILFTRGPVARCDDCAVCGISH